MSIRANRNSRTSKWLHNHSNLHFNFTAFLVVAERTVEHLIQGLNGASLRWRLSFGLATTHLLKFEVSDKIDFNFRLRLVYILNYFKARRATEYRDLGFYAFELRDFGAIFKFEKPNECHARRQ